VVARLEEAWRTAETGKFGEKPGDVGGAVHGHAGSARAKPNLMIYQIRDVDMFHNTFGRRGLRRLVAIYATTDR
jgi:hypothetical protein